MAEIFELESVGAVKSTILAEALELIDSVTVEQASTEVVTGKAGKRKVKLNLADGSFTCSCPLTKLNSVLCPHATALVLSLPRDLRSKALSALKSAWQQKQPKSRVIFTGLKSFDALTGGLPSSAVIGLFGPSKIGKTLLATQLSFATSHFTGRPALYIDTEGFYTGETLSIANKIFGKRYEKGEVKVLPARSLDSLLGLFGIAAEVVQREEKYDVMIRYTRQTSEMPLVILAAELQPSIIVVDSLSAPLKRQFGSATQNLPARSAVINSLLGRFDAAVELLDCPGVVILHAGKSPINPYDIYKPYGGATVLYNLKYLLLLLPGDSSDERRVVRYVWPLTTREEVKLKLERDVGYVD